MGTYGGVAADGDINMYTTQDMKDLTQSGLGTAEHEFLVWLTIIVLVVVVTFIISSLLVLKKKTQGLGK